MKRRRSGFTLIEVLVVIGVIVILIAIAVIGYRTVERAASNNQTKATLNNLNSMLAELDAQAGSDALPTYLYQDTAKTPPTQTQFVIGASPNALTPTPDGQTWTVGDVTTGGTDRIPTTSPMNMLARTQNAMATLMRVPNNKQALSQLPSSKILQDANGAAYPLSSTVGPVLLDGWGNPIIYVPPGGISVYVNTGTGTPAEILIKSRDNRPFFASAGPDGNFGAETGATTAFGDDNLYSKQ